MTKIPNWITKYNEANYKSSAGKAVRELIKIIEELENSSNQNNKTLVKADVNNSYCELPEEFEDKDCTILKDCTGCKFYRPQYDC